MSKHGYANVYLDRSSGKRFMGRVWLDRTSAENQIGTQIDVPSNHFVSASHLQYEGTAYVNWEAAVKDETFVSNLFQARNTI